VRVGDVDQLVGCDREAHPGSALAPVVALDPLVEAVAEDLLREDAVRAHVGRQHVHVVEPLDGGTSPHVPLGLVPPRRLQVLGRHVALRFVVELEHMAVRIGEAVRGPVTDIAVDPARAEPRLLDGGDPPLERLRAASAQGHVAETGLRRFRQLQAIAEIVAPAAQVDRPALPRLLLHAEHVDEEAQALVRSRGQELRVPDPGDVVQRFGHDSTSFRRPSRS